MPLTPQDFVSKWRRVTAREKYTENEEIQKKLLFLNLERCVGQDLIGSYGIKVNEIDKRKS